MRLLLLILTIVPCLTGCLVTDTGVTNPISGLSTVAVAPFLNLSSERSVDGRRFAEVYFSELQKIPGFEVVPVGVVEAAMIQNGLDELRGPEDAVNLAKALNVDAVVIGAVTDYKSYAPPRVGMKISWYSPYGFKFQPEIPIDPLARERLRNEQVIRENEYREMYRKPLDLGDLCTCPPGQCDGTCLTREDCGCQHGEEVCNHSACSGICAGSSCTQCDSDDSVLRAWLKRKHQQNKVKWNRFKKEMKDPFELHKGPRKEKMRIPVPVPNYRAQSPEAVVPPVPDSQVQSNQPMAIPVPAQQQVVPVKPKLFSPKKSASDLLAKPAVPLAPPATDEVGPQPEPLPLQAVDPTAPEMMIPSQPELRSLPLQLHPQMQNPLRSQVRQMPLQQLVPLMEYSRIFDATDSDLVAKFRDYYELSGDPRSGSWESRLHRTDDYIRFVTHLMIKEMLVLHGGEARKRIILAPRKFK